MKNYLLIFILFLWLIPETQYGQEQFVYVKDGRLYFPNGQELALWGVNLQPALSWEYGLLKQVGIEKKSEALNKATDESLDELELLGCRVIRTHLTPADFTDDKGNLVETEYLHALDYMISEAAKRKMYLYITFINHMGQGEVENSFMHGSKKERVRWIADEKFKKKSKNYISQLLNRTNPYSNVRYKTDTAVAVWEIINEPDYLQLDEIEGSPYEKSIKKWIKRHKFRNDSIGFSEFRKDMVLNYINEMYATVRKTGAKQPVSWCCNWHKMIVGHEDVFEAVSVSDAEVVSFCNYPGQDVCKHPYYENPVNLTRHDYSQWYSECYENREWYGWAKEERFSGKAKIVYEFETFYNQSAYLYPVMADFFRSMGVQIATMWHYSMPPYAPYRSGSHVLNLKCTPEKAASFAVAGKLFEHTPLLKPYHTESTTEWKGENYIYSYKKNMSVFGNKDVYFYSSTVKKDCEILPEPTVKEIFGYGNSPLVNYTGTGNYSIQISDNELEISIQPDVRHRMELWRRYKMEWGPLSVLDNTESRTLKLFLEDWGRGNYSLYQIKEGKRVKMGNMTELTLFLKPGQYTIVRN